MTGDLVPTNETRALPPFFAGPRPDNGHDPVTGHRVPIKHRYVVGGDDDLDACERCGYGRGDHPEEATDG